MNDHDPQHRREPVIRRPHHASGPGQLILTMGLPGSGKSTWVLEQLAAAHAAGNRRVIRLSRDEIRRTLFGQIRHGWNEALVSHQMKSMLRTALIGGYTVYNDDTNLVTAHRNKMIHIAGDHLAPVEVNDSFLRVDVLECIRRDSRRNHPVGESVIRELWDMYLVEARAC